MTKSQLKRLLILLFATSNGATGVATAALLQSGTLKLTCRDDFDYTMKPQLIDRVGTQVGKSCPDIAGIQSLSCWKLEGLRDGQPDQITSCTAYETTIRDVDGMKISGGARCDFGLRTSDVAEIDEKLLAAKDGLAWTSLSCEAAIGFADGKETDLMTCYVRGNTVSTAIDQLPDHWTRCRPLT